MYWKHLVSLDPNKLVAKFYYTQKKFPVKGDWVNQIIQDKSDFGIELDDEAVRKMSKFSFKKLVKEKTRKAAYQYLKSLKDSHSKMENINIEPTLNCKEYLVDNRLSYKEAQLVYNLRCRMYLLRNNFKNKYKNNLTCDLCKIEDDNTQHLYSCVVLKNSVPELKNNKQAKYEDLFGTTDEIVRSAKLLSKVTQEREALHKALNIVL